MRYCQNLSLQFAWQAAPQQAPGFLGLIGEGISWGIGNALAHRAVNSLYGYGYGPAPAASAASEPSSSSSSASDGRLHRVDPDTGAEIKTDDFTNDSWGFSTDTSGGGDGDGGGGDWV
jgi:hypothetical protein